MSWPGGFYLAKLAAYLVSPLTISMVLMLIGLILCSRKRYRWGVRLGLLGILSLWLAATPLVSLSLAESLGARYPLLEAAKTPAADAIVVLGGTVAGARPPERPVFSFGPGSDRVWHAAALYRAGKAPLVLIAAGNQPHQRDQQVEADAIAEALVTLGVPTTAIHKEGESRNTWENANNLKPVLRTLGIRQVLLVTSSHHMARSLKTFQLSWAGLGITLIPATTDVQVLPMGFGMGAVLPHATSLSLTTQFVKEYAALMGLYIMTL
jgi:uncharacterized SAM-binding protein YcdF (DUF218 family)